MRDVFLNEYWDLSTWMLTYPLFFLESAQNLEIVEFQAQTFNQLAIEILI